MNIPTTIMYAWHACILSPHGHTHYHHVCMACMHLISTWTYTLPSCMYGMHASYLRMDIPTTIMYVWHAWILPPHGHTHFHHVCRHACILSPHEHTYYHHVCMTCMHLISTWTNPLPSCMYDMHASYLLMNIPTTIMYVWHACILSPHEHAHYHHVCMACLHLIST